jgi:formate C-acetyltransferase
MLKKCVDNVRKQNRETHRLDGWFFIQEIKMNKLIELKKKGKKYSPAMINAVLFQTVAEQLPIKIRDCEVFAGTQNDGFSPTYALINPSFQVKKFEGYCDPMGPYNDIKPDKKLGITKERINKVRNFWLKSDYVKELKQVYQKTGLETKEAVYFVETVTGHTIADFRPVLKNGLKNTIEELHKKANSETDPKKKDYYQAMMVSINAVMILARRYGKLAEEKNMELIAKTCNEIPYRGAGNLYEAIQSFMLLWMGMVIEQSPNPYAFSVGNLDRILQPYYEMEQDRPDKNEYAVQLVRFFLSFLNVGDRSWAISQNILVGGKEETNKDLTCDMTYNVLDAFYGSNDPQPAISVRLHSKSPVKIYEYITKFLITPGHSTPSLFNDDIVFDVLRKKNIKETDLQDYSIAGCQEPLIMGKESANTTNSWLNLAKILELTLNNGKSLITNEKIGLSYKQLGLDDEQPFKSGDDVKKAFYKQLDHFVNRMVNAANECTVALGGLPVPFLSSFMYGIETGVDMRDVSAQGTKYNGSGCLIHGLANVADSFTALNRFFKQDEWSGQNLVLALQKNYKGYEELKDFLLKSPKYGNDIDEADTEATELCANVSNLINSQKNPWGNKFCADWSSPSTHLLYGWWVGATPDGRMARKMLNYGIDPYVGMATKSLPPKMSSMHKLPYELMTGGHASHIGITPPGLSRGNEPADKVLADYYVKPLFGFRQNDKADGTVTRLPGSFYVYFNCDSPDHLRQLLKNPKKYCPAGVYIMRIHGTFVNFLDLSPDIQEDIIQRLDL